MSLLDKDVDSHDLGLDAGGGARFVQLNGTINPINADMCYR